MRTLTFLAVLALAASTRARGETATVPARHTVAAADTLWKLAGQYYNDSHQWKRIYEANKANISDPGGLTIGQVLVIPGIEKASLSPEPAPREPRSFEPAAETRKEPAPAAAPPPQPPAPSLTKEVPIPAAPKRRPAPKKPVEGSAESAADTSFDRLSKDFPPPLVGGDPQQTKFVSLNWRADGHVTPAKGEMSAVGDVLKVYPTSESERAWVLGRVFVVCRKGEKRHGKKPGIFVQRIGLAEVVSSKDGRIRAKVTKLWDAVLDGDLAKLK